MACTVCADARRPRAVRAPEASWWGLLARIAPRWLRLAGRDLCSPLAPEARAARSGAEGATHKRRERRLSGASANPTPEAGYIRARPADAPLSAAGATLPGCPPANLDMATIARIDSPFRLDTPFRPTGDQPRAIAELTEGIFRGDQYQTLLGATGTGKTFTIANVIQNAGQADARPLAQQDARGPALRRVPDVLPRERRRVLHLVLRLLPARGLHRLVRHVHREGHGDQRGDRPAPPPRHARRSSADGRTSSSWRRVSCIYGLGNPEEYKKQLVQVPPGESVDRDELLLEARQRLLHPQRRRLRARHVPRARRHGRGLPGLLRGPGLPHHLLGRRGREDRHGSTRHGRGARQRQATC